MKAFVIDSSATIMEAIRQIDENKKGFLIVVDDRNKVVGTLTDGDIRRGLLAHKSLDECVDSVCTVNFVSLGMQEGIASAVESFKNEQIHFIPIVDEESHLLNIITKEQMHSLLLLDIHADLGYDFLSLDENIVDHEVYQRLWGFYKTTVMNSYFQSKIINVKPKGQLSLQSHDRREEYWIVAHGEGIAQIDDSVVPIHQGSSLFIPKGAKHRLTNTDDTESLIITEVQIGEYFGEDDIIRYDDIYGRDTQETLLQRQETPTDIPQLPSVPEIKMFLTDCDGCLTDGGMYYSEKGDEMKKFNTRDGMGFALLREKGIITGIITGEDVDLNRRRADKLKLDILEAGCRDKAVTIEKLCGQYGILPKNVCYIGDDINDLDAIRLVGFGCCPSNAVSSVKAVARYVAKANGGEGVVREVVDKLLKDRR